MKGNGAQDNQGGKGGKILLIILCGLLVIAIGVVAFILINGKMKESNYSEAVSRAEKYLAQSNYEDAIVEYEKAISIDPENETAYLGLASLYEGQGEITLAVNILNKGYEATKSNNLLLMLNRLNFSISTLEEKDIDENAGVDSTNLSWNTSFVQKMTTFDFDSFKNEYGSVTSTSEDSDGYLEVVHDGLDAVCYYKNTSTNKNIVDTMRKTPYASGMPEKIQLNNLLIIFRNWDGYVSLERIQMMVGTKVQPKTEDGRTFVELNMGDYIIKIETDSNGTITSSKAWNEITLPNANQGESGSSLSGVVLDAVSGDGVKNAELTFEADDKSIRTSSTTTNLQGAFSIDLEPAVYTITITADGYIEEEFEFTVEAGKTYSGEQFTISPSLTRGTARIVLEWNAEPRDLDSYLEGETDSGKSVFISYRNKKATSGGDKIAELDLDDVNGYGPETTTIYDLNGTYTFTVVDFMMTGTMSQYGATVKVYLPGQDVKTISIDSGASIENIWTVCEIDHGELKVLNKSGDDRGTQSANK